MANDEYDFLFKGDLIYETPPNGKPSNISYSRSDWRLGRRKIEPALTIHTQ